MTEEQYEKLRVIGKQIQEICPETYGSIRFNLKPGRDSVNVNFEESKILTQKTK
jgi:hypothetical protein